MNLSELSDKQLISLLREHEDKVIEFGGASTAIKYLLNGGYGALSNQFNRWYSDDVAESFTLSGQLSVKWVEKYINVYLNHLVGNKDDPIDFVIAVDTDSVYIKLDSVIEQANPKDPVQFLEDFSDKLQEVIQKALSDLYDETNAYKEKLSMGLEAIGPAIWVAKKRYVMSLPSFKKVRYDPPKLKIMGIDAVRSSTPKIVREYIEEAIPMLIAGTDDQVKKYVEAKREDFFKRSWDEVSFPRGTNDLGKYSDRNNIYVRSTPIHVRAALLYNYLIKERKLTDKYPLIQGGDKIRFCYMRLPNPLNENVFGAPDSLPHELGLEEFIDYNMQFEKAFFQPIKKIIDAAGINLSDDIDISQFMA